MKKLIVLAILLIPSVIVNAQGIGELAPEKKPEIFPDNTLGLDVMFSEGGIGFGGFYRRQLGSNFTGFIDFSISESKDEREFEYVDYFGQTFTIGKKNRLLKVYCTTICDLI
jgi:hypothetical protein